MPILDTIATKGTAIKQWFFSGKNQVRVPAMLDDAEGGCGLVRIPDPVKIK